MVVAVVAVAVETEVALFLLVTAVAVALLRCCCCWTEFVVAVGVVGQRLLDCFCFYWCCYTDASRLLQAGGS